MFFFSENLFDYSVRLFESIATSAVSLYSVDGTGWKLLRIIMF